MSSIKPVNQEDLKTWLSDMTTTDRITVCLYLGSPEARTVLGATIDEVIADEVSRSTWKEVADRHGWSLANVAKRIGRHRSRTRSE